jgi:hypothetical protein
MASQDESAYVIDGFKLGCDGNLEISSLPFRGGNPPDSYNNA